MRGLPLLRAAATAACLGAVGPTEAQPGAPLAPLAPLAAQAEAPDLAPFEGRVAAYLLSPEAGVAGLLFDDGRQVRVPPHLGTALAALAKPGDRVRIGAGDPDSVGRGPSPLRRSITSVDSGRALPEAPADAASPPRPAPREDATALHPLQAAGTVRYTLLGPRGEANGVVLDNGVQVAFPPHVMREAGDRLGPGKLIQVQGYGRTSVYGTIVQATEISGPGMPTLPIYGSTGRP